MENKNIQILRTRRDFIRRMACGTLGAGMTGAIRDLRLINAALASNPITDYKAMVCVFLQGGNDSNNLVIPTIPSEYASYAAIRTPILAIPNTDGSGATALALHPSNSDGHNYAIHPACPGLQTLFNAGKAATLFNVGSLVYPMTRAQYNAGTVTKPPQLFSHSDQVTQWQTSVPDRPPTTGWGGRMADLMEDGTGGTYQANLSQSISFGTSIFGTNTWERGISKQQYNMSTSGAIDLSSGPNNGGGNIGKKNALLSMMGVSQTNYQCKAYADAVAHALNEAGVVNAATSGFNPTTTFVAPAGDPLLTSGTALFPTSIVTPNTTTSVSSSLSPQLKMVAQLIEAGSRWKRSGGISSGLDMNRQIFYVQIGSYDTHTNQNNTFTGGVTPTNAVIGTQANLFSDLSRSLYGFYRAMEILGLQNNVTCFTASDFGRTFPSNGQGSDHGWGSHHLIVGGAVNGGKTYGTWPTLTVNGPDDTSTGRWIPTTSVDQYAATLASWFGVSNAERSIILPNLGRFAAPPAFL
jgi:uncharacterized protein (DUF1501 family)